MASAVTETTRLVRTESQRQRKQAAALHVEAEHHERDAREAERELQRVRTEIAQLEPEPHVPGLDAALPQLTALGLPEEDARRALLMTEGRPIRRLQIEQAMDYLFTGDLDPPDTAADDPSTDDGTLPNNDRVQKAIDDLMMLFDDKYRTDEYRTCYRILMEKDDVQWRVPQAAEWLFSRANGSIGPMLDSLPLILGVRAQAPVDTAGMEPEGLARGTSMGTGRNDIVWEWERDRFFGMPTPADIRYLGSGGVRADPNRWGEYPVDAMAMLDVAWAKGEGNRGAVLVRSGGAEYLVDLSHMTQTVVGPQDSTRRVRRRRVRAEIGPLSRGETLSVMEDPSLSGDTIIAPQSYIERLDMFKIGRRNRAAVFRLSVSGAHRGDARSPRFLYCRGNKFHAEEGTCWVPSWIAQSLQLPRFGSGVGQVRVEPWLLPTCGGVKLKCLTPGFEELVRAGAAEAADGSFDVTSVLSGPLSKDFCTLTSGSIVPIHCGERGDVFEFLVTQLRRTQYPEEEAAAKEEPIDAAPDVADRLNVDGVDLKSVFNAELALDMTYLTDDIGEIRRVAPNLDDAAAREILQSVGFDLLEGLNAAQAAGAAKEVSDRREQAREVKRLQQLAGVNRAEAERALSANGWSLSAAQASLAGGVEVDAAGGNVDDEGAELRRGPSTNTLRNRRLEMLAGVVGGQVEAESPGTAAQVSLSTADTPDIRRQRRLAALAARGV